MANKEKKFYKLALSSNVKMGILSRMQDKRRQKSPQNLTHESWQVAFDALADAAMLLDADGRIIRCNQAMAELLKAAPETFIGKYCFNVVHLSNERIKNCPFTCSKISKKREVSEVTLNERLYKVTTDPILGQDGELNSILHIMADITEQKEMEHQLQERIKELRAFYYLAKIVEQDEASLDVVYQQLVEMLPDSWQYPESTCARLQILGKEYVSSNFQKTEWVQSAPIQVHGATSGKLEISYLEEKPASDEGPFMKEERLLIDAIAEHVGHIAEQKVTNQALIESTERYRSLIEQAAYGIFIADSNGKFQEANSAGCELLGYTQDELRKLTIYDITSDADVQPIRMGEIKEGKTIQTERELRHKDGTVIAVELTSRQLMDGRIQGIVKDIRSRKQAEEQFRQLFVRNELILSSAAEGILGLDTEGRHVFINKAAERMLGYNAEELIGQRSHEIWHRHKQDGSTYRVDDCKINDTCINGTAHRVYSEVFWKKDGTSFPVEYSSTPIYDNGVLTGAVVTFTDITVRKRSTEQLRRARQFLQSIQDSLSAHIAILDQDGYIVQVNTAWCDFADRNNLKTPDYGVGLNYLEICDKAEGHDAENARVAAQEIRAVLSGEKIESRFEYECSSLEEERWFELHITKFEDRNHSWVVLAHENITKSKKDQQEITHYGERLSIVVDIEHRLASLRDETSIYSILADGMQRLFPDAATIFITLFDEERKILKAAYGSQDGIELDVTALPEIPLAPEGQGTQSRVIRSRQPLIIQSDLKNASKTVINVQVSGANDGRETQSAIYVPMMAREKILGLVQCQNYESERFSQEDIKVLSLVANTAAGSIQNARLFAQTQNEIRERTLAEGKIQKRNQMLLAIHNTTLVMGSERHLQTLLTNILEYAQDLLNAYRGGGIYLYNAGDEMIHLTQGSGINRGREGTALHRDEGVAGTVYTTAKPLVINDYTHWEKHASILVDSPSSAVMGVPLFIDRNVAGVLLLIANSEQRQFDEDDVWQAEMFAAQAAVAIQNADLFEMAQVELAEREQAEQALRASEAKYRLLAENIEDVVWLMDIDSQKFVYISPSVFKLRGYAPEEALQQTLDEMLTPKSQELIKQTLKSSLRNATHQQKHTPYTIQLEQPCKDGTTVWTEVVFSFVCDEQGTPSQILGLSRNITERLQVEEQINAANERLQEIIDNISDIFWVADTEQNKSNYVSPAFDDIVGISYEEMISRYGKFSSLILDEDQPILEESYMQERRGESTEIEYRIRRPDGSIRWLRDRGIPILSKDGSVKRVVGVARDITQQKEADEKLRESEQRFRQIAENIQEAFWVFDRQNQEHVYANQSYEAVFDVTEDTLLQSPQILLSRIVPEDLPLLNYALEKQAQGKHTEVEYRVQHKNGSIHWIWDRSFPVYDNNGSLIRTAGVATDITERKQASDLLKKRIVELEMLYESGLILNKLATPQEIGQKIIELLETKMNWRHTIVRLYHPENDTLEALAFNISNLKKEKTSKKQIENIARLVTAPDHGISGWVIKNRQAARNNDIRNDPRHVETYEGMQSGLYVPIQTGDMLLGVISIESREKEAFDDVDERLAMTIANQAAGAIHNALFQASLEQRVTERTAEVSDLYENAPNGYHSLDKNGRIVMINQTELNWLGYSREEILGKSYRELFSPESKSVFDKNFPIFLQQGWIKDLEFDLIRKDGSILPILLNGTAIYDAKGTFLHSRSTIFDMTTRKEVEKALRENEETYRALFESANDAIFLIDMNGILQSVNPQAEKLLGYSQDELVGHHATDFVVLEKKDEANQNLQRLVSGEHLPIYERTFIHKSGTHILTEINLSLIRDANGHPKLSQSVVRNITERKQAELALAHSRDQLSAANAALEKAARLKDEFLASMSHELRTPLTGVLGLSEALQLKTYGELNEKQLSVLRTIHESGRHLLELINDILDLSKIEAGKLDLQFAPCSVEDVCQASLQLIKGMAQQKNLSLSYEPPAQAAMIRADVRRLKQILVNLLSNAVKFTPQGGSIGLKVRTDENQRIVQLEVWDTGIGIRAEDMDKLFKPFSQIDSSLSREYSGTGLGLSLVKRLTELHNGGVTWESVFGEGSRFIISLPWSPQNTTPIPYVKRPPLRNLSAAPSTSHSNVPLIAMADDNETLLQMVGDFLESRNYQVLKARSGAELLNALENQHPRIILIDVQMPGMNGLEVIQKIRAHPKPEVASAYIIVITAMAMAGDRERCMAAGADEYLSKPVRLKELDSSIQKIVERFA